MARQWFRGSDEFSPDKCARSIRRALAKNADPEERATIKGLFDYHTEYLRVTADRDGNRPCPMADGTTTVYWSWQAATSALFFVQAYNLILGSTSTGKYDWDRLWDESEREAKGLPVGTAEHA